jgi:hypothetical protein
VQFSLEITGKPYRCLLDESAPHGRTERPVSDVLARAVCSLRGIDLHKQEKAASQRNNVAFSKDDVSASAYRAPSFGGRLPHDDRAAALC